MSFFISQEKFKTYITEKQPKINFDETKTVIALSTVKTNPIINCLYIDKDFFFAARYHSALDFFSDNFCLENSQIKRMYLIDKQLSTKLIIETNEILNNQTNLTLKMNLPKLNFTPWHVRNLKLLRTKLPFKN
ncbi:hypothetical protein [Liquorilactobacillus sicerae]|uniref:hypothetical protein n=1 Tax=Liquorilactobacillus sicerae TaxID=1416943 RepID=UPI0024808F1C|nr:hypothetical protein [Liquorilactobacillus sicerae]